MSEPAPRPRLRALDRVAGLVAVAILAAVVGVWAWDRTRRWETPAWDARRLVTIEAPQGAPPVGRERWLVAVHPTCPHCRSRLVALHDSTRGAADAPWLGALIVDAPARPDTVSLAAFASAGTFWDSTNAWRARWGHRVYGEAMVFDADGRYRRTVPPGAAIGAASR